MNVWRPPADQPQLLEWWRPLLRAARRGRQARVLWPIDPTEFELVGRFIRAGKPDVWLYVHDRSAGELLVDDAGRTYDFVPYKTGRVRGRFREISVQDAVWRARLPDLIEPDNNWWPLPRSAHRRGEDVLHLPEAPTRVTRMRHLRLVSSHN
jgi:hypothetical protein